MENLTTTEEIKATKTFKSLDKCFQNLLIKLSSLKQINYGLICYYSSGIIPPSVGGNNLKVLNELIKNKK